MPPTPCSHTHYATQATTKAEFFCLPLEGMMSSKTESNLCYYDNSG